MISVIVPVYKVESFIRRCVDSILSQSFDDFEVILVDDGSPDKCGAICDEYKDKDPRVVSLHKENGGLSSARNSGIEIARGEYLCFVDSDDWLDKDYLTRLYELMSGSGADMSACALCDAPEGFPPPDNKKGLGERIIVNDLMLHAISEDTFAGFACNKLFKTRLIIENGLRFDETIFNGEDLPFVVEYLKYCNKAAYTGDELYFYNVRPGSITTTRGFSRRAFTIIRSREHVLKTLSEYAPECVDIERAAYIIHLAKMKYLLDDLKDEYPEEYSEIKEKIKQNKKSIPRLKGVSVKRKIKLFVMVYFDGISGIIYRKKICG